MKKLFIAMIGLLALAGSVMAEVTVDRVGVQQAGTSTWVMSLVINDNGAVSIFDRTDGLTYKQLTNVDEAVAFAMAFTGAPKVYPVMNALGGVSVTAGPDGILGTADDEHDASGGGY